MRNKMIELLNNAWEKAEKECGKHFDCRACRAYEYCPENCMTALTADHLLANGATFIPECKGCVYENRKRPQKCSCCRRNKDMADLFKPEPPKEEV